MGQIEGRHPSSKALTSITQPVGVEVELAQYEVCFLLTPCACRVSAGDCAAIFLLYEAPRYTNSRDLVQVPLLPRVVLSILMTDREEGLPPQPLYWVYGNRCLERNLFEVTELRRSSKMFFWGQGRWP